MRKSKKLIALFVALIMALTFIPSINSKADDVDWHIRFTGGGSVNTEAITATWNLNINNVEKQVTLTAVGSIYVTEEEFTFGGNGAFTVSGDWDPNTMEVVYYDDSVQNPEAVPAIVEYSPMAGYTLEVSPIDADPLPKNISIEVREKAKSKIVFNGKDNFDFEDDTATVTYKNGQNQDVDVTVTPGQDTTLVKVTENILNGEEIVSTRDVLYAYGDTVNFAFDEAPNNASYNVFADGQRQNDAPIGLNVANNTATLTTTTGREYEFNLDFVGNGGGGGGNNNEAKIVFRGVNQITFDQETSTATITYQNAQNEDVAVTVTPAQGTTLEKRPEEIYNGETPTGNFRDVLITNDGAVDISFTAEPLSANYTQFINGQPQTGQPVDFEINNNETSLTTVVGSEYEVNLDFAGNGGGGGQQQPVGDKTARILISGMEYNNSPTWTGTPGYGHEPVTTYYDKYWFSTQFAINENGEHGDRTERWDMFSWEDNYTDEQIADATERYGTQVITYDKEDGAETVDISVFLGNWGDRIDAIKINGLDYSNQLHLDGDPTKPNIFDDEASMLRLFKDQGIYITIKDVPVNECEDDGIDDEYNIQIAASPNSNCYIGNFLWSQDDYYAPIEMGGIEPSDKYIGKSTLTLMDIYYQDGTFDPNQEPDSTDGFYHLDDGWYKHIAVDDSVKEYTNEEMPAIHYQLDRRGYNPETHSESGPSNSEMVMPTGTWVKMKIQPEQGYQVESFSGVNRNAGNVKILSDEAGDACIFMFKIDSGNFHIGANVVPYDNTADTENSDAVSAASVDLEAGTLDGGTGELSVEDIQINDQDAAPYKNALAGNADDYTIEAGLDLSLNEIYLKGGAQDDNADAAWKIEKGDTAAGLANPAEITLSLDDIDLTGKNVQIVHKNNHLNNTVYEPIEVKGFDPETNAITFDAESFSDYAILTKEAQIPEGQKAKLRINTTIGVISGDNATFTYKDGDETVGVVKTANAVALESEEDNEHNVVSQFMYTTSGDSVFIVEPANEYYKPEVLSNGNWIDVPNNGGVYSYQFSDYNLSDDGLPVKDVQFRFVCTRTYDISFAEPTLTVGEGEEAITADVVGIQGFDEALTGGKVAKGTNIAGLGAKDNITLSGFDPDRMVVRITAAGTTGWAKVLNPIPVDDNYVVSLGMLDVPEGSTGLVFSIIEKTNDQPGPNGGDNHGDDARVRFHGAVDISKDETTGKVTLTYLDDEDEEVPVIVTAAKGIIDDVEIINWRDDESGDEGTDYVLYSTGGLLTIIFPNEPEHTVACWGTVVNGQPSEPVEFEFDNFATSLDTVARGEYDVDISFRHEGPQTEVIPASDATEDVAATEVAIDMIHDMMDGKNVEGINDDLRGRIEEAINNGDDIVIDVSKEPVAENKVSEDAKIVKANLSSGQKVAEFYDVDVNVKINNEIVGQITELKKPISVTLDIQKRIFDGTQGYERLFSVASVHNKKFIKYSDPARCARSSITVPITELSTFAILYKDVPVKSSTGVVSTSGIYCLSAEPNVVLGFVHSKSNASDDVEFRWEAIDADNTENGWFEVSPWTKNNEWLNWSPKKSGNYVIVGHARVVGNPDSEVTASLGVVCHKGIKGICQMPYEGGGFLIGIESYENPNQSYKYEMLILDCSLLAQGKDAWIYSTGKCGVAEGNALWTIWQPKYGYYWTLFRIYDENDELIDEQCFGFVNN